MLIWKSKLNFIWIEKCLSFKKETYLPNIQGDQNLNFERKEKGQKI